MALNDISGRRFGRLVVVGFSHRDGRGKSYWNVACDCGATKVVAGYNLGKNVNSCGCLQAEARLTQSKTHGKRKTKTYNVWAGMKQRCNNPNAPFFDRYGGRGIKVCERWNSSFANFIDDMGECPDGMTIERIDNNLGYSKSNCKWASKKEQARNRCSNKKIEVDGEVKTLSEWAEKYGINVGTVHSRVCRQGWEIERAIKTPARKVNRNL